MPFLSVSGRYNEAILAAMAGIASSSSKRQETNMTKYRNALPQLDGRLYLTDGGIETSLIFHQGIELPDFAAFDLFKRPGGEAALREYFRNYARIAARFKAGLILESATWRASADWGLRLGYAPPDLEEV